MKKKIALITGISGQDGAFLSEFLLFKGYNAIGTSRTPEDKSVFWRLDKLGILDEVQLDSSEKSCKDLLELYKPDEIYHLAGQSSVGESFKKPFVTIYSSGFKTLDWLEAIRIIDPTTKFYNASSSEIFGEVERFSKDEQTGYHPRSPYAVAKLFSHFTTINYREAYNIFACNGILFNHESYLRGKDFVTQKIARCVAEISLNKRDYLDIGNLDSKRDWGHARDYIVGMFSMMHTDSPDDYVLATGNLTSVRDFIQKAFKIVGIDIYWSGKGLSEIGIDRKTKKTLVKVNEVYYRPSDLDQSLGNSTKARNILKWKPEITLNEIIKEMIFENLKEFNSKN